MAKKISDMDPREIERIITHTLGSNIADFKLGGKLRKLAQVIQKLMSKSFEEGIEEGESFESGQKHKRIRS